MPALNDERSIPAYLTGIGTAHLFVTSFQNMRAIRNAVAIPAATDATATAPKMIPAF
jgi:hypothetical protein